MSTSDEARAQRNDRDTTRQAARSYVRLLLEARVRGFLALLILILPIVALVCLIGASVNAWDLARHTVPVRDVERVARQTRNVFVVVPVSLLLLVGVELTRRLFERWAAARGANDVYAERSAELVERTASTRQRVIFWIVRLSVILFPIVAAGLAASGANPVDTRIFLLIGLANALVWALVVRTRGPWTLNRGGRLERPTA